MAGWWLTYPSEKYSVGNIWQSQYMEKEKMFRITNQYITGNPSQISLALAAARSYPIHPAKPILSQKTRRLSFCMATSCSIYEPKSCRFFLENMSVYSSAQPTLRGIRRVVSLDAMLKFPGRRRCNALDFSDRRSHRDGYWLPGPCWGQKKDASYSSLSYVCLFGLKSAKAIAGIIWPVMIAL